MEAEHPGGPLMAGMHIENLKKVDGEESLLGQTHVFGVLFHVWFIRVKEDDEVQVGYDDPHNRLDDIYGLDEDGGSFNTVEVPGFEGDYVMVVYPGK
jgi:hypothetical protein